MPVAAGISAAGALGSGLLGFLGSSKAASAQAQIGQQALSTQQQLGQQGLQTLLQMWGQAKDIAQPVLSSALSSGQGVLSSVLPTLSKLLTPGPDQTSTLSQLPGFQFAQDWGQKAVANQASTTGLGGNVLTAGANYATGLAQQGFGTLVNALQSFGGLGANLLGTGAGVANQLVAGATGAGQSALSSLMGLGSNLAGTLTGIGGAQAQGILGQTNALSSGLSGAAGAGQNAAIFSNPAIQSLLLKMGGVGASGANANPGGIYAAGGMT